MNHRRFVLTSITLLCLFGLAACGGSDNTKSSTAASGSATTAASGASASGTTAASDAGSASAPTTTIAFKGAGSGSLCDYAKDIESSKALSNAFTGNQDPATVKAGFSKALDVINTAVGKAPSEIKGDLQTLQTGFKAIADFYASYGYDFTKLTAAIQKDPTIASKFQTLDSADFNAASDRVDAYFSQVCGISTSS